MHALETTRTGWECGVCGKFYDAAHPVFGPGAEGHAEACCACVNCKERGGMVGGPGRCKRCELAGNVEMWQRNRDGAAQEVARSVERLAEWDAMVARAAEKKRTKRKAKR